MATTIGNVRALARARGYRLSKLRSPYAEDQFYVVDGDRNWAVNSQTWTLEEAEEWLREQPTVLSRTAREGER